MLELRRKRVLHVMGGVLLVFGVFLLYFLFFNSGLQMAADPAMPTQFITVSNDSVHQIRDISVSYVKAGKTIEIEKISKLNPSESRVVPLNPEFVEKGAFTLQVSAPFHLGKQIAIDARTLDPSAANISFSFQYPSIGIVGQPVRASVDVCNNELFAISATLALFVQDPSLASDPFPVPMLLSPRSCANADISFMPAAAAPTLSFKIRVSTPSSVLVEKVHTMEIVPDPNPTPPLSDGNASAPDGNASVSDENSISGGA